MKPAAICMVVNVYIIILSIIFIITWYIIKIIIPQIYKTLLWIIHNYDVHHHIFYATGDHVIKKLTGNNNHSVFTTRYLPVFFPVSFVMSATYSHRLINSVISIAIRGQITNAGQCVITHYIVCFGATRRLSSELGRVLCCVSSNVSVQLFDSSDNIIYYILSLLVPSRSYYCGVPFIFTHIYYYY